jgi:hypothetical protein
MRRFLARLIVLALSVLPLAAASPTAPWIGDWSGVLEYRDYKPPHGRVSLPTKLSVTSTPAEPTTFLLRFVYDDGPGKIVKSASRLSLDLPARRLVWSSEGKPSTPADIYELIESSPSGDRLVFLGQSTDDDKPSRIRYTFTTAANSWRILKETTSDGPEFAFRHEYRLTK